MPMPLFVENTFQTQMYYCIKSNLIYTVSGLKEKKILYLSVHVTLKSPNILLMKRFNLQHMANTTRFVHYHKMYVDMKHILYITIHVYSVYCFHSIRFHKIIDINLLIMLI